MLQGTLSGHSVSKESARELLVICACALIVKRRSSVRLRQLDVGSQQVPEVVRLPTTLEELCARWQRLFGGHFPE